MKHHNISCTDIGKTTKKQSLSSLDLGTIILWKNMFHMVIFVDLGADLVNLHTGVRVGNHACLGAQISSQDIVKNGSEVCIEVKS